MIRSSNGADRWLELSNVAAFPGDWMKLNGSLAEGLLTVRDKHAVTHERSPPR